MTTPSFQHMLQISPTLYPVHTFTLIEDEKYSKKEKRNVIISQSNLRFYLFTDCMIVTHLDKKTKKSEVLNFPPVKIDQVQPCRLPGNRFDLKLEGVKLLNLASHNETLIDAFVGLVIELQRQQLGGGGNFMNAYDYIKLLINLLCLLLLQILFKTLQRE